MSHPRPAVEILADILTESEYALEFVQGHTLDTFRSEAV